MGMYLGGQKISPIVTVGAAINNQDKTITENGTYTADAGYTGLGEVTVDVSSTGEYDVIVIDYDGTVLEQKSLNSGDTFTLPSAPTHTGLVFQSWSCPETITNNTVTVTDNDIVIGATYTTASGHNEIEIVLNSSTGLNVGITLSGSIDWGDGTTEEGSGSSITHTYPDYGTYIIKNDFSSTLPTVTSNTQKVIKGYRLAVAGDYSIVSQISNYAVKYITMAEGTAITKSSSENGARYGLLVKSLIFPNGCTSVSIGAGSSIKDDINYLVFPSTLTTISGNFNRCHTLKYLNIPNSVTSSNLYSTPSSGSGGFYQALIKRFAAPSGITTVPILAFSQAYLLEKLILREGITTFTGTSDTAGTNQLFNLKYIKFPSTITTVSLLSTGVYETVFDFSSCTSIPTLSSSSAVIPRGSIIKVPTSLEAQWKTETNWLAYADYITGV